MIVIQKDCPTIGLLCTVKSIRTPKLYLLGRAAGKHQKLHELLVVMLHYCYISVFVDCIKVA